MFKPIYRRYYIASVILGILLVSFLSVPLLGLVPSVEAESLPKPGWLYRKSVTINHALVVDNLVNFPVLIDITDTDLANDAQPDGDDIYFTDINGVQLSHDIESYSAGHLISWVKANLSSAVDTTLYMYYGNDTATNQEDPPGVWDSNFMMVQHLSETSGTHYDSSSNGNNGSPVNGVVQGTTGKIDGADDFDGTNDYITVPHSSSLTGFSQGFTASFWVRFDSITGRQTFLNKWNAVNGQRAWYIEYDSSQTNKLALFVSQDGSAYSYWRALFNPVASTWYHIDIVWRSGQQALFYVNGAAVTATTSTARTSVYSNTYALYIGNSYTTGRYMNGVLDEVCLSNSARSAQWLSTCYNNQVNPSSFYVVGAEESFGAPIVSNPSPLDGAINVPITLLALSFDIEDPNGDLMNYSVFTNPNIGWDIRTGQSNGTNPVPVSGLSLGTTYTWLVSVTDGSYSTDMTYNFTTVSGANLGPVVSDPIPVHGATDVSVLLSELSVMVSDPNGDLMNITGTTTPDISGGASEATKVPDTQFTIPVSGLTNNTTYTWHVNATDGTVWTNMTYQFTTGSAIEVKSKTLVVNSSLVAGSMVDFPVLVDITDGDLASEAQPDGSDIFFTDIGHVQLSHEIELYDAGTGHLIAWVRVPDLSSSADTTLYLCYGEPGAGDPENPGAVWDSNFVMVQHLEESSGTLYDSTGYGNNGSPVNGVVQGTTGKIDGADDFDGTNDYITVPHSSSLTGFSQGFTASFWVRFDSITGRQTFLNKWNAVNGQRAWYIEYDSSQTNKLALFVSQDGSAYSYWRALFNPVASTWYHIDIVWRSGQQALFYVNGAAVTATTSTARTSVYSNTYALYIGNSYTTGRYMNGVLDEVCLSNSARSAEWILTSYNNQLDPSAFISLVSGIDFPVVVSTVPASSATGVAVGTTVQVTFSEPMNTTITQGAFSISPSVPGNHTWSSGDTVLTFDPSGNLAYSTVYTCTISTAAVDKEGDNMVAPYSWSFTTAAVASTPPTIVGRVPVNGAMGVAVGTTVQVTFSEPMNTTITQGAFSISPSVPGNHTWSSGDTVLTFDPSGNLAYSTVYTCTISTAAMDKGGDSMVAPYSWKFTTAAPPTYPTVVSTVPVNGAMGVAVGTTVQVTFSEPMATAATESAFSINPYVSGTFAWLVADNVVADTVLTFTPNSKLAYTTAYTVTVSTAAEDKLGDNMVAPYSWSFITAANLPPVVVSTVPFAGQEGVSNNTLVQITFSEAMDRAATNASFSISSGGSRVNGTLSWNTANTTMTFTRDAWNFSNSAVYTATITTAAKDMEGANMTAPYTFSFKIVASSTSPYITAITPARDAQNVSLTTTIRITFNEAMDPASVENGFSISPSVGSGPHTFAWSGNRITVTLNATLATDTTYTVTMSTGAMDTSDEHMEFAYSWSFTTPLSSPPHVESVTPALGETNVRYTIWGVNWSEPMSSSLTWAAFSISPVAYYNDSRWINSSYVEFGVSPLTSFTTYTVTISTNVRDNQGENMTASYSFTFTTGNVGTTSDPWSRKWMASVSSGQGTGEQSPLIADITSDIGEEVLYAGVGLVRCLNGRTGVTIWSYSDSSIGWNVQAQMGDIDNDGQMEIVVPLQSPTGMLVLNTDNTQTGTAARSLYWKRTGIGGSSYTSKPLLVDPDGDGYWMVICAPEDVRGYSYDNSYTARIWTFNYDGREINNGLWGTAGGTRSTTNGYNAALGSERYQWFAWRPCSGGFSMADTDNDGLFELFQNDRDVYYSDGDFGKGTKCWEWNATTQRLELKWYQPDVLVSSHTPILVDVNKDGVLDVVVCHQRGGIAIFNSQTGAEMKKDFNIGLPVHYQMVVYDIDRDGNPELLCADGDHPTTAAARSFMVVFDLVKWKVEARMYVGPCKFGPTVAEVTGDGIMDMVAVSDKGVFIFDGSHDPSVDQTYPVTVVDTNLPYQCLYAVVQDIDADGLNEIVVTSSGYKVYAYDTPGVTPGQRPRSEVQYYNERRTGVAEYVPPVFYDRTTPILSAASPSNEAANVPVSLSQLHFTIEDLQGDSMDYNVTADFPVDAADLIGLGKSDGTYNIDVTATLQNHTKYTWSVSVTDGLHWNHKTYTFTTPEGTPPGSAPTHTTPLLESDGIGEYEDSTSANLTCTSQGTYDANGDEVTNIYRWLRNNQSMANLIMPFDTDSLTTAKDYSGYNNNAQIHGATWTSNGVVGGAYSFDGLDDYMIISDGGAGYYNGRIYNSNLGGEGDWHELTVEMWINFAEISTKESARLLMKLPSYEIGFGSVGGSQDQVFNSLAAGVWLDNPDSGDNAGPPNSDPKATEYWSLRSPSALSTNTWYHVAFTYKDGEGTSNSMLALYINGSQVRSSTSLTTRGPIKASSGEALYIGWYDYFKGMIDEVRIYSTSLSAEQILQRYTETKDGITSGSTLSHKDTMTGDVWSCQVIPNDSHWDGTARTSNSLTILPGPQVAPVVSQVRVLDSETLSTSRAWSNNTLVVIYNYADENDDPEVFGGAFGTQIKWYENSTYRPDLDNLLFLSPSITAAHYNWTCQVKPGDGYATAANWTNATNTIIVNSLPEVTDYSPEYGFSLSSLTFTVGQTQTFSFTCNDLDNDTLTIYWQVGSVNATEPVIYAQPATSSFTWTAPALGSYTVRARISDTGYGSSSITQSWSIVVR